MSTLKSKSYSLDIFEATPERGNVKFFVEGTVNNPSYNYLTEKSNYGTEEYVSQSLNVGKVPVTGSALQVKYLFVPTVDKNSESFDSYLGMCNSISFCYRVGSRTVNREFHVEVFRRYQGSILFQVTDGGDIDIEDIPALSATRLKELFWNYSCSVDESRITLEPYYNFSFLIDDYNPLINNNCATTDSANRLSTVANKVEIQNGVEKVLETEFVQMVDSFYTEQSNISPRYLGCKKGFSDTYTGKKRQYTSTSLNVVKGTTNSELEQPFASFTSFSGSIFPRETSENALKNMSISEIVFSNLRFLPTYSADTTYVCTGSLYSINSLPDIGDIIYSINFNSGSLNQHRIVESVVYVKDSGKALYTNAAGVVESSSIIRSGSV